MHGAQFLSAAYWAGWLGKALQGLLVAIPVAALFELSGWLVRRWALRQLGAALARDQGRDAVERARRRRTLRDDTVLALRWLWNLAALTVILLLWGVDPVAVGLLTLAVVAICWGLLREYVAGYSLLLDDCLAPGDHVVLPECGEATVVECGPRRVRLQDAAGRTWFVPNSAVSTVQNQSLGGAPRPPEASDV